MSELCLIDVNKENKMSFVSPCLKKKGHNGKHQHEGLCKWKSCMCHWAEKEAKKK